MIELIYQVDGTEILRRELQNAAGAVSDLTPAFEAAQTAFYDAEADNFQSQNTSGKSGRWADRSENYEKRLGTFALLAGVERLSDTLYKSLTRPNSQGSVSRIAPMEAEFGTSLIYARAQHYGYEPRNLPSRPLIDLSDAQIETMSDAKRKAIVGEMQRYSRLEIDE